jgi:hypothetical protein
MNENKQQGLEVMLNGGLNQIYTDIVNKFFNYDHLITFIFQKILQNNEKLKEILLYSENFSNTYLISNSERKLDIIEFANYYRAKKVIKILKMFPTLEKYFWDLILF